MLREICEEYAKEELHTECSCEFVSIKQMAVLLRLTVVGDVIVHEHSQLQHHPVFRFCVCRRNKKHVDHHAALQQWQQSPLIVIVNVP